MHYMSGGVRVDETAAATVPGLFAAGECAGGLWGANRVASALSEVIIQGRVAGGSAAKYALANEAIEPDPDQLDQAVARIEAPLGRDTGIKPFALRKRLQDIAGGYAGVIKTGAQLERALSELKTIREEDIPRLAVSGTKSRRCNAEWWEAVQALNLVQCLEMQSLAALKRTESRGAHYRADCTNTNNEKWLKNLVCHQANGDVEIDTVPVVVSTLPLPGGVMTYQESIGVATATLARKDEEEA